MENHIMSSIKEWNQENLSNLVVAANEYHKETLLQRRPTEPYTIQDARCYLDANATSMLAKSFSVLSNGINFDSAFECFAKLLGKTTIRGTIISLVPCDLSHYICVTTESVYGIEAHRAPSGSNAFITIYCDSRHGKNNNNAPILECQWTYLVENVLSCNNLVSLKSVKKELIKAVKDGDKQIWQKRVLEASYGLWATYSLFIDDACAFITDYSIDMPKEGRLSFFELFENLCLVYDFENAFKAYSFFCTSLSRFNIKPAEIDKVSINIIDPEHKCYEDNTISAVSYRKGNLVNYSFTDDDGGHWSLSKDSWSYHDEELSIDSKKEKITIKVTVSISKDSDWKEKVCNLPDGCFSHGHINHIVELATTKYIPKYFA